VVEGGGMMFWCNKCNASFSDHDYFWDRLGQNVTCPTCHTEYETDWDYTDVDEGNAEAWITGEADKPATMTPEQVIEFLSEPKIKGLEVLADIERELRLRGR
jgi:hypothetical protein